MKLAILGTGNVGRTIGTRLVQLGHEVCLGSRTANNEHGAAWAAESGPKASTATFADAARFGELAFNCTLGGASVEAMNAAGEGNLAGKIVVDVSNPLDFSQGMPPTLSIFGVDSLGEQIQRALPKSHVVKALNTISCEVMVHPERVQGRHVAFVSGNDAEAKRQVETFLREQFGWQEVLDLGDITTARGTEAYLLLWIRLWAKLGTADFNVSLAAKSGQGSA